MFLQRFYSYCMAVFCLMILVACGGETPPPAAPAAPAAVEEPSSEPTAVPETTELPPPAVVQETEAVDSDEGSTDEPAESSTTPASVVDIGFEYNGLYFDPGGLGTVLVNEVVQQTDEGAPFWAIYPAYTEFQFEGYPLANGFHTPRVSVYPAADFANLNPIAREMIVDLEGILAEKPTDFAEREIPHLPLFNAAQVFRTQIEYVPFANGEGIRFVTYYSQAINPISNFDIFYSFQGLTSDGGLLCVCCTAC